MAGRECSLPADPPRWLPLTAVAAESNWAVVPSADVERSLRQRTQWLTALNRLRFRVVNEQQRYFST